MASSSILRRWFSRGGSVGILRISIEGASHNSCCSRELAADRKMSTAAGGVRSPGPPWLMLPPRIDGGGSLAYKFHRLAENDEFSCDNKFGGGDDINIAKDVDFAGSSHGWLALFNRRNFDLHLSNPITDRHIKLPPPPLSPPPPAFRVSPPLRKKKGALLNKLHRLSRGIELQLENSRDYI